MGWSGISLSYTSICITVLNFESGISLACLFWVAALYIPHKHSQNLYLIIFNVVCLLCVKIVQIGCLRCIDKSSQRMFSPTKMQTIWDLYWLKGIRKAAAWGQLCCKTSVCTLIRTALCSGSKPHIITCIYLHVQVASQFVSLSLMIVAWVQTLVLTPSDALSLRLLLSWSLSVNSHNHV